MKVFVQANLKQAIFYFSWGLILILSIIRYQAWHLFDKTIRCSEDRLLAYAQAALKPENWLAIGVAILTVVAIIRLYGLANSTWLWFSHYGRFVIAAVIFIGLLLLSWSCNGI